ncbi:DNA-primase RepB domain-containing protein [Glaciimonas sp. CA11.2]|uniref:DNA-primase RepB domain-containing protein n=1 Tax=Glaciimonas sp. CA11.2 TaxID=3048601 RepID=UPI002AB3A7FA|nr:DNA-primase RepB domain-containing protein [Glaciimonas sp. CA11.2]MDY7546748.1 DNA-primase RepB domain-containing protein [Glaciimonas sp. CA11.2]MEB0164193.1 DNA-primase RepB domain-containing protein [Glaciimonas sp. CA11.2]
MKADLALAEKFLQTLDSEGIFTFQTFHDEKNKNHRLSRVLHGTLAEHQIELDVLNQQGAGIFVMVNRGDGIVKSDYKTCRTNANVTHVRAVFVDLDGAPLQSILEAGMSPNIIVKSSPGRWHAYWRVNDCPLEQFKSAQTALANRFDGDPTVVDLARVMRIPGFYHRKGPPVMTTIYEEN